MLQNDASSTTPSPAPLKPWHIIMCAYCGERIETPFDQYGRPKKAKTTAGTGKYCSPECADAIHSVDNKIRTERRFVTRSFIDEHHSERTHWKPTQPDKQAVLNEETNREKPNAEIVDLIRRTAYEVDPRLPGILVGIENGESQAHIAKRLKVTQQTVGNLLAKLRASVSGQADNVTNENNYL